MQLSDEQFERIARWFDGEQVELTEAETQLARQIRDQEAFAADALEVQVPVEVMASAGASMRQVLTRRPRRNVWFKFIAPAAVAAVILLSVSVLFIAFYDAGPVGLDGETIMLIDEDQLVEILIASDVELWEVDLALLEDQLLMASLGVYDEAQLDQLDKQLQDLWLDPILENSDEPLLW